MPASGGSEAAAATNNKAKIDRLRLELSAINGRIAELERQHPEVSKLDALKASALSIARQIDDLRCSSSTELTALLAK